ncbi:MAG: (deoxy)nucleoside triphosphate pyrophosphohydrolase [Akkermansia sp.]
MIKVCCALIHELYQGDIRLWVAQKDQFSHLAGLWEFPGGKIEPGESNTDAIIREIKEELNIAIIVESELEPVIHDYGTHCIKLFPLICHLANPLSMPFANEHQALALLTKQTLSKIPWAPADKPVLKNYLALTSQL